MTLLAQLDRTGAITEVEVASQRHFLHHSSLQLLGQHVGHIREVDTPSRQVRDDTSLASGLATLRVTAQ